MKLEPEFLIAKYNITFEDNDEFRIRAKDLRELVTDFSDSFKPVGAPPGPSPGTGPASGGFALADYDAATLSLTIVLPEGAATDLSRYGILLPMPGVGGQVFNPAFASVFI